MDDDDALKRRAGKGPDDAQPEMGGGAADPDPSDYADPRVAQAGDDPEGEDAMRHPTDAPDRGSSDRRADGEG